MNVKKKVLNYKEVLSRPNLQESKLEKASSMIGRSLTDFGSTINTQIKETLDNTQQMVSDQYAYCKDTLNKQDEKIECLRSEMNTKFDILYKLLYKIDSKLEEAKEIIHTEESEISTGLDHPDVERTRSLEKTNSETTINNPIDSVEGVENIEEVGEIPNDWFSEDEIEENNLNIDADADADAEVEADANGDDANADAEVEADANGDDANADTNLYVDAIEEEEEEEEEESDSDGD